MEPATASATRLPAPPVPQTVVDLINQRKSLRTRTLNDDVEDIHLRLWQEDEYRRYFQPIWREETIEGSFIDDDACVAQMVRKYAREHNVPIAKNANLASIRHSLQVVARRYGLSRKERQRLVGGEHVESSNGDDE
jgi:hypothetical protein